MKPSIQIYEVEEASGWVHEELDFDYIDQVAMECSWALARLTPVEAAYQPGDGTCYNVVLLPLAKLARARARVVDGLEWKRNAIDGMGEPYPKFSFLLTLVGGNSYPIALGGRGGKTLSADYVCEHWFGGISQTSAVSIALLLRAIDYHLDRTTAPSVPGGSIIEEASPEDSII